MTTDKLVTIIIPVYNRDATIRRCLDSIAMQRCVDRFELIIVDNNSTDDSVSEIKQWQKDNPQIKSLLTEERRQGAAAARNAGLSLAETRYVMFFDSDDEMLQGHLERLIKGIEAHPEGELFGWSTLSELPDGRKYLTPYAKAHLLFNHLTQAILATEHYAVSTSLIKQIGGWNPEMKGWDDYELGVRILVKRPKSIMLPDGKEGALVRPRFTPVSITGSQYSPTPEKWEVALESVERTLRQSCPKAVCWVGFRRAILAGHYAREGAAADAMRLLAAAPCEGFSRTNARICYEITRLFGRGARVFASRVLPTDF